MTVLDSAPFLQVSKVDKSFGKHPVLRGVDLSISRGEVVAVIGPSGGGKSTLLRCINQLEAIDGGEIRLEDEVMGYEVRRNKLHPRRPSDVARQRRRFGMVFQQFNLFPNMTAIANVTHGPRRVGKVSKAQALADGLQLLARVGLAAKANYYPSQLSGGQQQRVAIARALAMQPAVMLFDEPTSALDPSLVSEVLGVIRDLSAFGQTMVMVTHEMKFAFDVADTVAFMGDGRVIQSGPPAEFLSGDIHPDVAPFLRDLPRTPTGGETR